MRKLKRILRNPLVVVVPLVVVMGLAWQQYVNIGRELSQPSHNLNILPNASFAQFSNGVPAGWQLAKQGELEVITKREGGHVSGSSVDLNIQKYKNGDATFTSPTMELTANTTYLFKGYYSADMGFDLLADFYYKDGTHELKFVQDYPGEKGVWSTASSAFNTGETITAVQFVYRMTSDGTLRLNGLYLEPKREVSIPPAGSTAPNIIPNKDLVSSDIDMPLNWTKYQTGRNVAAFSYLHEGNDVYLQTTVSKYKSGEAKWQFLPQPVIQHQRYQFGFQYKSNTPAQVVVEYDFQDGHKQFVPLANVSSSGQWTTIMQTLEVPPGAVTMFVSVVLQSDGTLATRHHSLTNITKPGAAHWNRPLVSITFDDGWESSYAKAIPLLDKYGFKATYYINPSSIETPNFMRVNQLIALRDSGHEVAAHGYSHDDMTSIRSSRLDYQLREGRDYLGRAGFPTMDFSTPYGKSDAEVQWYAKKYFKTHRGTVTGVNTRQNYDPYNVKVLYLQTSTKTDEIKAALRDAKQFNGWVVFVYHRVGNTGASIKALKVENPALAEDTVAKQIAMIRDSGIAVEPLSVAHNEVVKQ